MDIQPSIKGNNDQVLSLIEVPISPFRAVCNINRLIFWVIQCELICSKIEFGDTFQELPEFLESFIVFLKKNNEIFQVLCYF